MHKKSEKLFQIKKVKKKNLILSENGTTMVEVLIAFLVVMLMMGMFSKVISTSVHMLGQSKSNIRRSEAFSEEFYSNAGINARTPVSKLILTVDNEKTAPGNRASEVNLKLNGVLEVYTSAENNLMRYTFGLPDD